MIGTRIAHYEITAKLGQGGMGEVYRARDTKLDREVAIKVLPVAVSQDAERLARFEREAKTLAALNHPNIAGIFGLEHAGELQALVLELLEGEDLSSVLQRGPLPVTAALEVAREIAKALEVAHEKGIVHRDLKPGNIKYLDEGQVKVLDFGLAKALADEGEPVERASSRAENAKGDGSRGRSPHQGLPHQGLAHQGMALDESPTITDVFTKPGTILGTAAYMSPEQARGKVLDRRADVWSFGCVLFECLTGKRAFKGEDTTETLAAILKGEPDWDSLPNATPPTIALLLRRCLAKDRKRRLRDMNDIRIELDDAIDGSSSGLVVSLLDSSAPAARIGWGIPRVATLVVGAVLLTAIVTAWMGGLFDSARSPKAEFPSIPRMMELALPLASHEHQRTRTLISPDGLKILYQQEGRSHLYLHDLTAMSTRQLPFEEFSPKPFWSPDSQEIGLFSEGRSKMFRLNLGASEPLVIANLSDGVDMHPWSKGGGAWLANGDILFCDGHEGNGAGLWRVPAGGGDPELILEPKEGERSFRMPSPLPNGNGITFLVESEGGAVDKVVVYSEGERRTVFDQLPGETLESAIVDRSGYLIYDRKTTSPGIWAVALAPEVAGPTKAKPFKVAEGTDPSVSQNGALIFLDDTFVHKGQDFRLVWFNRAGTVEPIEGIRSKHMGYQVSLSGNEDQALASVVDEVSKTASIWLQHLDRPGVEVQVTNPPPGESDWNPTWHPDGEHFFFRRSSVWREEQRGLPFPIMKARLFAQDEPIEIVKGMNYSISEDGRFLVYETVLPEAPGLPGVAFLDFEQENPQPQFLPGANVGRRQPVLSPDGRYLAFIRHRPGRNLYFLTQFPSGEGEWQISGKNASIAFWGANPLQPTFYFGAWTGRKVWEKKMTLPTGGGRPKFEPTTLLYDGMEEQFQKYATPGLSRDGQRFLIPQKTDFEIRSKRKVILKLNWEQGI